MSCLNVTFSDFTGHVQGTAENQVAHIGVDTRIAPAPHCEKKEGYR